MQVGKTPKIVLLYI